MYDVALWTYFSATAYNKFKSAYNKCVKKMFGYMRRYRPSRPMTDVLVSNQIKSNLLKAEGPSWSLTLP